MLYPQQQLTTFLGCQGLLTLGAMCLQLTASGMCATKSHTQGAFTVISDNV